MIGTETYKEEAHMDAFENEEFDQTPEENWAEPE